MIDTLSLQAIIPDEEIERVHGNARFGSTPKRRVVNEGVLKVMLGYSLGRTQRAILREHGLIWNTKGVRATLSAKGRRYLVNLFRGKMIRPVLDLLET